MTPEQYVENITQRELDFLALGYDQWEAKAMARLHDLSLPVTLIQLDLDEDDTTSTGGMPSALGGHVLAGNRK